MIWATYSVDKHVALELRIVEEALFAPLIVALELPKGLRVSIMDGHRIDFSFRVKAQLAPWNFEILLLTSLSPCTVMCFLSDALSLNIFAQESKWHLKVLTAAEPPILLPC